MCGIAGIVSKNKKTLKDIKKMSKRIEHRGPDGEGYFQDEGIALAHRRLAIIDIDAGKQPMFNEDESVVVVFNGEIYNYKELRDELIKDGHVFKTESDTEVLVHGYEKWKDNLPKHLRGMFAFAIYDKNDKSVFLARDNFGIKPLYYTKQGGSFMFASEIKAFLDVSGFKKEFNEDLLEPYLEFSFVPMRETFFKNVYRLDAGSSLLYKDGDIALRKYYEVEFDKENISLEKAAEKIHGVMTESVERHLLSDVEVGSFLSSGVDSSYIVSLARPKKTFTASYGNLKYDEGKYTKDLAEKLGISNKSVVISKKDYQKELPNIMYYLDEPTSDPAALSLYFVAKLASKDVKVVLSGEGADEFFGGYNYYRRNVDAGFYGKFPFGIRRFIGKVAGLFPEGRGINFLVRQGERLEDSYIGVNRNFSEKMALKVLKNKPLVRAKDLTKDIYDKYKDCTDIQKMQAIDIHFWLANDILLKADRMSMASSLEGRVPFIDKKVFEVAKSLPDAVKVSKENTKMALRMAAKKVIPTDAYNKKKLGFPVPVREWIKDEDWQKDIRTAFSSRVALKYFNQKEISKLFDEHLEGKKDNYRKVWTIYSFIKWYEVFF